MELFVSENDFKSSSVVHFPRKRPDFGDLETNQRQEPQARSFFHICPSTYELSII